MQTLIADVTNVHEMILGAGGNKIVAMTPQILGKQELYLITLSKVDTIGAVTYNPLTGKYINNFTVKIYELSSVYAYMI